MKKSPEGLGTAQHDAGAQSAGALCCRTTSRSQSRWKREDADKRGEHEMAPTIAKEQDEQCGPGRAADAPDQNRALAWSGWCGIAWTLIEAEWKDVAASSSLDSSASTSATGDSSDG